MSDLSKRLRAANTAVLDMDTIRLLLREAADALVAEKARGDEAVALLRTTTDELDGWGWGDLHYGSMTQDTRVVERVAENRAFLAREEDR